jgi:hypothetical protein
MTSIWYLIPFVSPVLAAEPPPLRVSTLFTAQEMAGALAGEAGREEAVKWCRRHSVDHAFVESFRDGYRAKDETLVAVRDRFRAEGIEVSGCVTPTGVGKASTGWKAVSCYTSSETRLKTREIFEGTARLFEEIMIDDFLFTDCTCPDCVKARGDRSWADFRCALMRDVSEKDILAPARVVRPGVKVIIKYPQWYDLFHERGYDVAGQTAMVPRIWVGTETRDPENRQWGRKAQYEAYFIMRWLGAIGGEKTGGGWFDPYGTSPATYLEQARQTVLGGAREMLLFCHGSLVEKGNAACPEALISEIGGLKRLARWIHGSRPIGVAAAKPPSSQPAKGEEYIFDFIGMLGIPLVPCTAIPAGAPAALITSHAASDPATIAWLRESPGRPVLITAEAEKALPAGALGEKRSIGRLSWKADPRELMDLSRETLDALRAPLLAPLGLTFSASGRVALYVFEYERFSGAGSVAIENFNDAAVEIVAEGLERAESDKDPTIQLPPPVNGKQWFERKPRDREEVLTLPPRSLAAWPVHGGVFRDPYGGLRSIGGTRTGFFHVETLGGRDWLISPEGAAFLSKGVNHLTYEGDRGVKTGRSEYNEAVSKKHGSRDKYLRNALTRLRGWGFNTLGAWCDREAGPLHIVPYTVILDLAAATTPDAWLKGNTADVFSPEFEAAVRKRAEEQAKPLAGDPWLLGWFTDNELSFGPDWRQKTTLLERMLALPFGSPGERAAAATLADHAGDRKAAAGPFAGKYARRYFQVCRDAIRAADPNHVVLGARFAGPPAREVVQAAKGLVDIFSVNVYATEPNVEILERIAGDSGAPVIVGEFTFRAADAGLPNTRGAGPRVAAQLDRADGFERYVRKLLSAPRVVGYHWFQHADQPAEGRFDGEDSNYGLVDLRDEPYKVFVERATAVNAAAEEIARKAVRPGGAPPTETAPVRAPARGPLRVHPVNHRYFADDSWQPVYLTGAHTWPNLVDMGESDPPPRFDFPAYLDFLVRHDHNFIRLWTWEPVSWDTRGNGEGRVHRAYPQPYARTGPGEALDGKPRFDLRSHDREYFERLRSRVTAAGNRGIYVSVMLFEGWGVQFSPGAWKGHPFNGANNVNGIDGDADGDGKGLEVHELVVPAVTEVQEAYVRKVADTLADLDNVLYEISNENHPASTDWQYHMIRLIHEHEAKKLKRHPVGMTFQYKGGSNKTLFESPADWISPNPEGGYRDDPPSADGKKVILTDTDHLWGIGGDVPWVWKSFLQGLNPLFMDPYDGKVLGPGGDPKWDPIRRNLGYTLKLSRRLDLAGMEPRKDLASSGYCLAKPGAAYVAWAPGGKPVTVDLSAAAGKLRVEWLDPATGESKDGGAVEGGAPRTLAPPFASDGVVIIRP